MEGLLEHAQRTVGQGDRGNSVAGHQQYDELADQLESEREEVERQMPFVAMVVDGSVPPPRVVVAGAPVAVMTIDFERLGQNGTNADALSDALTWVTHLPDKVAMGQLQDQVVNTFRLLDLVI
jgi:hypothetical protein